MTTSKHPLDRLLRAAADAPREAPGPTPFGLEAGVLSQWRDGGSEDDLAFLLALFRRAVLCAVLVMVLALGWSWLAGIDDAPSKTTLPQFALTVQLRP